MKQKAINIIAYIVSAPIVLFEYFVLFWFWGGADAFNFILTPIVFGIYLIVILYIKNKFKSSLTLLVKLIYVLILPILTIVTVWLFASIFGINIIIW